MVKLGEDTGALDKSLSRLAEIYEDDMKRKIQAMTVIIEPVIQLVLGGILGIVALGILLPVYNVISGLK
jgi:type IV pilus assembly protein PilC